MVSVCWGLVIAGAAGCGDSGSGEPLPALHSELAMALARVDCESFRACCEEDGFVDGGRDDCVGERVAFLVEDLRRVDDLPRVALDTDAAVECIATLEKQPSGCLRAVEPTSTACARLLVGRQAEGEPCDLDRQCRGGPQGDAHCADGLCRRSFPLGARCERGEECTGWSFTAYCGGAPTRPGQRYCVAGGRAEEGQPCSQTLLAGNVGSLVSPGWDPATGTAWSCSSDDGLSCDDEGRCVRAVAVGDPCQRQGQCAGGWCDRGTCRRPSALGEACQPLACREGLACEGSFSLEGGPLEPTGVCSVPLSPGAECRAGGPRCATYCDFNTGTCAVPPEQAWCEQGLNGLVAPAASAAEVERRILGRVFQRAE